MAAVSTALVGVTIPCVVSVTILSLTPILSLSPPPSHHHLPLSFPSHYHLSLSSTSPLPPPSLLPLPTTTSFSPPPPHYHLPLSSPFPLPIPMKGSRKFASNCMCIAHYNCKCTMLFGVAVPLTVQSVHTSLVLLASHSECCLYSIGKPDCVQYQQLWLLLS